MTCDFALHLGAAAHKHSFLVLAFVQESEHGRLNQLVKVVLGDFNPGCVPTYVVTVMREERGGQQRIHTQPTTLLVSVARPGGCT
jgi:hypothetical protein